MQYFPDVTFFFNTAYLFIFPIKQCTITTTMIHFIEAKWCIFPFFKSADLESSERFLVVSVIRIGQEGHLCCKCVCICVDSDMTSSLDGQFHSVLSCHAVTADKVVLIITMHCCCSVVWWLWKSYSFRGWVELTPWPILKRPHCLHLSG